MREDNQIKIKNDKEDLGTIMEEDEKRKEEIESISKIGVRDIQIINNTNKGEKLNKSRIMKHKGGVCQSWQTRQLEYIRLPMIYLSEVNELMYVYR